MIDYENKTIAVEWCVDDVRNVVINMAAYNTMFIPRLTEEEMFQTLVYCERNHDAGRGINWNTIRDALHHLYRNRERRAASLEDIEQTLEDWKKYNGCTLVLTDEEKQLAVDYFNEHDDGKRDYWDGIEETLDKLYGKREVFAK